MRCSCGIRTIVHDWKQSQFFMLMIQKHVFCFEFLLSLSINFMMIRRYYTQFSTTQLDWKNFKFIKYRKCFILINENFYLLECNYELKNVAKILNWYISIFKIKANIFFLIIIYQFLFLFHTCVLVATYILYKHNVWYQKRVFNLTISFHSLPLHVTYETSMKLETIT